MFRGSVGGLFISVAVPVLARHFFQLESPAFPGTDQANPVVGPVLLHTQVLDFRLLPHGIPYF